MSPLPLAAITVAAGWLLAGGTVSPAATIAVVASTAALVAARERRHCDMALAIGIAAGLSSIGLALLPVLLGTAIARQIFRATLLLVLTATAATMLAVEWMAGTDASLLTAGPADTRLLFLAMVIGMAAWITASCAARSPSPDELDGSTLLASLALPLLAPIGVEAAGLAIALAIGGTRLSFTPIARGANDDPLPLRVRSV